MSASGFHRHMLNHMHLKMTIRIRIRIRIYLLAGRNLLWDILRLPSSRRAALGLYVILTLWRTRGANQPPYASLHKSSPCYALRHGRRYIYIALLPEMSNTSVNWPSKFCCNEFHTELYPAFMSTHAHITRIFPNIHYDNGHLIGIYNLNVL